MDFPFGASGSVFAWPETLHGHPPIWDIVSGITGRSCGNGDQHQIHIDGLLTSGIYHLRNEIWWRIEEAQDYLCLGVYNKIGNILSHNISNPNGELVVVVSNITGFSVKHNGKWWIARDINGHGHEPKSVMLDIRSEVNEKIIKPIIKSKMQKLAKECLE